MFPAAMVLPMFNGQPLVSPRPAASASAEIPRVWQCAAHDLHHHHHFVRLRFSRRMPLFNCVVLVGSCQGAVEDHRTEPMSGGGEGGASCF